MLITDVMVTVDEYRHLRRLAGWVCPPDSVCAAALSSSMFGVSGRDVGGQAVCMGRIVGDGLYGVIVDVVVALGYRRCGLGSAVVDNLLRWASDRSIPHLGLVADDAVAGFYRRWPLEVSGQYLRLRTAD
ncbi:GNAT family N-acetyltransferase [Nocardia sp. IFM 10818]